MTLLNKIVRRIFAWPLVIAGAVIVNIGGALIIAGTWVMDYDVKEILAEARKRGL